MADKKPTPLMASSFTATGFAPLQRKCACGGSAGAAGGCDECNKKKILQRRAIDDAESATVPPIVHSVLRSPGQPLDVATRAFFEPRFGHDFSKVRVHADTKAAESARAVNALAYTVKQDIAFGEGQYAPGAAEGRRLLAHELTHTVQQGGDAPAASSLRIAEPGSVLEREADAAAEAIGRGSPYSPRLSQGQTLARQTPAPAPGVTPPSPPPPPMPPPATAQGCCCCADDLDIYDPFVYEPPTMGQLAGHMFTTRPKLSYTGTGAKKSCGLEWWEKTDRPYILVTQPNTWTQLAGNPNAKSIGNWYTDRKEPCPGQDSIRMVDSPGLGLSPGLNATRTLEFRIGINSGKGCASCANKSKKVSAKQYLKVVNGKLDKDASYFKTPNPDETQWK